MVDKIKYIVNILIVVLLLATVAINRDGRVVGCDVETIMQYNESDEPTEEPIETTLADGTRVINSSSLGKDIIGFGGRTPVKVYVKNDVIERVEYMSNSETPSFFDQLVSSGLFEHWKGMTLAEAAVSKVDGVSGATYSSDAIIANVRSAASWGADVAETSDSFFSILDIKDIVGLLVVFFGVFLTLSKSKNKRLIVIAQVLNVVVLGFWCGAFLSLTTFTTWVSNGVNISLSVVTFAMFCVVIIMPLVGKKGSYCQHHCPMGAAQELMARVPLTKIKINPKATKVLNNLRYYILSILLLLMWLGVGFDIMNYEVFSAFIFSSASTVVLVMAVVFLALSLFITRPYCRFICPTGALLTISQKTK